MFGIPFLGLMRRRPGKRGKPRRPTPRPAPAAHAPKPKPKPPPKRKDGGGGGAPRGPDMRRSQSKSANLNSTGAGGGCDRKVTGACSCVPWSIRAGCPCALNPILAQRAADLRPRRRSTLDRGHEKNPLPVRIEAKINFIAACIEEDVSGGGDGGDGGGGESAAAFTRNEDGMVPDLDGFRSLPDYCHRLASAVYAQQKRFLARVSRSSDDREIARIREIAGDTAVRALWLAREYVTRASRGGVAATPATVHRLVLSATVVATKFLIDEECDMKYFARAGGVSTRRLVRLERALVFGPLRFDLASGLDRVSARLSEFLGEEAAGMAAAAAEDVAAEAGGSLAGALLRCDEALGGDDLYGGGHQQQASGAGAVAEAGAALAEPSRRSGAKRARASVSPPPPAKRPGRPASAAQEWTAPAPAAPRAPRRPAPRRWPDPYGAAAFQHKMRRQTRALVLEARAGDPDDSGDDSDDESAASSGLGDDGSPPHVESAWRFAHDDDECSLGDELSMTTAASVTPTWQDGPPPKF